MQDEYVREVNLSGIIKTVRINLRVFLLWFIPLTIIIISLIIVLNYRQITKYTVKSTIQVNNFITQGNNNVDLQMTQYLETSVKPMTALLSSQGIASSSQTMTKLLTSEYILQDVIESNNLDIDYKYLPNKSPFTWFNKKPDKQLEIGSFEVNHNEYNIDYIIRFSNESTYVLSTQTNKILGIGKVGVEGTFSGIKLLINSYQPTGSKFSIRKKSIDVAINDLNQAIDIEPVVINQKYTQADTGIIDVTMTGTNPAKQAQLVNDIILRTQQKTLEQQQRVLNASLAFLAKQIDVTRADLLDKQAQLVKFQDSKNVVNLDEQVKRDLAMLTDFDVKIMEKQVTIDQFKNLYAPKHPLMVALQEQKASLIVKRDTYAKDLKHMPANDALYANIKRNLDVSQQLYLYLVNKEQNLQLQYASTVSPVSILNYATQNVAPIIVPLSMKLIASVLLGLFFVEVLIIVLYVFMVNGDPFLFAKEADVKLLSIVPFFSKKRKALQNFRIHHPSMNTLTSYLLHIKVKDTPLIVNFGGIKSGCGKSFIISTVIEYLHLINKRSLHIQFGTAMNYMTLSNALLSLQELNTSVDKDVVLKINTNSILSDETLYEMLSSIEGFDFIFVESPALISAPLFFRLARVIEQTIIVTVPQDTDSNIQLAISGLRSLEITPKRIIFNHPKKALLNSVYSITDVSKI